MKKKLALVYDAVYPWIKGGGEKRFYDIGLRLQQSKQYDVHFYGMKLWKGKDVIKANALVLNLVRNFSGHNFESKLHKFFKNSNKYLARIIFSLIYIKKQGRI